MSFEPGKLSELLGEALGEDASLAAELRALFLASATGHVAAMTELSDAARWRDEALKLQGLAASFGIAPLIALAADAAKAAPDTALLDGLARAVAACR